MKINTTKLFTLIFAAALFFFSAQQTLACSCMAPGPDVTFKKQVTDSYAGSTAVFTAEVISIGGSEIELSLDRQVKIKVTKVYKGTVSNEIIISTARDSAMCGYEFAVGKTYLIYANGENAKLSVNNCSRTKQVNGASTKKELKMLKDFDKKRLRKL